MYSGFARHFLYASFLHKRHPRFFLYPHTYNILGDTKYPVTPDQFFSEHFDSDGMQYFAVLLQFIDIQWLSCKPKKTAQLRTVVVIVATNPMFILLWVRENFFSSYHVKR